MTSKHALREAATKAKELGNISRYTKAMVARLEFKEAATPDAVLALLDELEAKDKRIAELEQRQQIKPCPKCNDTGMVDSGGTQPWGEPIEIECDCRQQDANTAELVAAGIITRIEG